MHAIGSFEEIVAAERDVNRGRMPERPFVLVGQQYLADPTPLAGRRPPGLGLRPRARAATTATPPRPCSTRSNASPPVCASGSSPAPPARRPRPEAHNANYVGGDIVTGANTPFQTVVRPRLALDPYATGIPGVFICSAATPPGAGAHGMCGYNAAQSVLRCDPSDANRA